MADVTESLLESPYPEHAKLEAIVEESQAVGAFLDSCVYTLCQYREAGDNGEPIYVWREGITRESAVRRRNAESEPDGWDFANGDAISNPMRESWPSGWYPVTLDVQRLLAEHYGIDLNALEREKRAMLEALRSRA
jgi:hypothetical protein